MHSEAPDDDDVGLPCAVGLVAATLALMTTWAAPAPDAAVDAERQRWLIARKVVSNLFFLSHHPDVSPPMRNVAGHLHRRWVDVAQSLQPAAPGPLVTAPALAGAGDLPHVLRGQHLH